jgi:hypothetical protein
MNAKAHEIKEHTLQAFTAQLRETRALLGDRLDLYQVHSMTEDSPVLGHAELQHALGELRDEGVRLGLSTSGPRQADVIRAALDLQVNGAPLFSSVQATWNLLETSSGTALSEAPPQLADELTGESEDPIRYWAALSTECAAGKTHYPERPYNRYPDRSYEWARRHPTRSVVFMRSAL